VVAVGPETLDDVVTLIELGCEAVVTDLEVSRVIDESTVDLHAFARPHLVPVR
jgi:hypothetical protein